MSVRSVIPCRITSCPAANGIRWVNPSKATVSPGRINPAIASRRGTKSGMALVSLVQRQPDVVLGQAGHGGFRVDEILEIGNPAALVEWRVVSVPVQHGGHPPRKALRPPGPSQAALRVG